MKLLAWNIQQGGARRASAILEVIERHAPDVLVLTELRPSSIPLLGALAERGWGHQLTGISEEADVCAGVLAREPLVALAPAATASELPGRWIEAWVPTRGMVVAGVYGPLRNEPYHAFWRAVLTALPARVRGDYVLAGDLNTGEPLLDAPSPRFFCAEHFVALRSAGLVDVWRQRNADVREHSYHHRLRNGVAGAGFRLDHVLASPSLASRAVAAGYDRTVLQARVSDHAAAFVEFTDRGAVDQER